MNQPSHTELVVCRECGAENVTSESRCWMCHVELLDQIDSAENLPKPTPSGRRREVKSESTWQFSLQTLVLVTTLISLCLGVVSVFPGLGILVAIVIFPVFVRTSMVVHQRASKGKPVELWRRVTLFLGSFATSIVILVVVGVASVGTFCAACFVALPVGGDSGVGAIPVAIIVALVATVYAVVYLAKWVRHRYRRDIQ